MVYKRDDIELIITLLNCNSTKHRWDEAKILAEWGTKNYLIKAVKKGRKSTKSMSSARIYNKNNSKINSLDEVLNL